MKRLLNQVKNKNWSKSAAIKFVAVILVVAIAVGVVSIMKPGQSHADPQPYTYSMFDAICQYNPAVDNKTGINPDCAKKSVQYLVYTYYTVINDREPDEDGFNYWTKGLLSKTLSESQMAGAMTDEYYTGFTDNTNVLKNGIETEDYVQMAYNSIGIPQPDAAGKKWWIDQLNGNKFSRSDLIVRMADAAHYPRSQAQSNMANALKTVVATNLAGRLLVQAGQAQGFGPTSPKVGEWAQKVINGSMTYASLAQHFIDNYDMVPDAQGVGGGFGSGGFFKYMTANYSSDDPSQADKPAYTPEPSRFDDPDAHFVCGRPWANVVPGTSGVGNSHIANCVAAIQWVMKYKLGFQVVVSGNYDAADKQMVTAVKNLQRLYKMPVTGYLYGSDVGYILGIWGGDNVNQDHNLNSANELIQCMNQGNTTGNPCDQVAESAASGLDPDSATSQYIQEMAACAAANGGTAACAACAAANGGVANCMESQQKSSESTGGDGANGNPAKSTAPTSPDGSNGSTGGSQNTGSSDSKDSSSNKTPTSSGSSGDLSMRDLMMCVNEGNVQACEAVQEYAKNSDASQATKDFLFESAERFKGKGSNQTGSSNSNKPGNTDSGSSSEDAGDLPPITMDQPLQQAYQCMQKSDDKACKDLAETVNSGDSDTTKSSSSEGITADDIAGCFGNDNSKSCNDIQEQVDGKASSNDSVGGEIQANITNVSQPYSAINYTFIGSGVSSSDTTSVQKFNDVVQDSIKNLKTLDPFDTYMNAGNFAFNTITTGSSLCSPATAGGRINCNESKLKNFIAENKVPSDSRIFVLTKDAGRGWAELGDSKQGWMGDMATFSLASYDNSDDVSWGVIHEIGHNFGLLDEYQYSPDSLTGRLASYLNSALLSQDDPFHQCIAKTPPNNWQDTKGPWSAFPGANIEKWYSGCSIAGLYKSADNSLMNNFEQPGGHTLSPTSSEVLKNNIDYVLSVIKL